MVSYDKIFVTNLPSFYKINLYNEINKRQRVLAVFTESGDSTRNADFYKGQMNFDYIKLDGRNFLSKIFWMARIVFLLKYKTIVVGGWDSILAWICMLLSPRRKNALALESSVSESSTNGIKGILKRIFLSRISKVYASGQMHKKLLDALGYKGDVIVTRGVGIYNVVETPPFKPKAEVKNFIYVGRFIPCKNLENLVKAFEKFPDCTAVDNARLPEYYRKSDVLILPSYSETWGVVVEEALNNGIPAIISENVGCKGDVVVGGETGVIFSFGEPDGLVRAIERIRDIRLYDKISRNIRNIDFAGIRAYQINCYI